MKYCSRKCQEKKNEYVIMTKNHQTLPKISLNMIYVSNYIQTRLIYNNIHKTAIYAKNAARRSPIKVNMKNIL